MLFYEDYFFVSPMTPGFEPTNTRLMSGQSIYYSITEIHC